MLVCAALLVIISGVFASEGSEHHRQCGESTMKLVLKSHYNQTGSWQSQVVFKQHEQTSLEEDRSNQWVMDVRQTSSVCDEGKSTLETTIYLTAPTLTPVERIAEPKCSCPKVVCEQPPAVPVSEGSTPCTPPPTPQQPKEVTTPLPELKSVPSGYQLYPGVGYYKFHATVTAWPTARDRCAQEGGHLVVINSKAEREVVRQLFSVFLSSSSGGSNSNQMHAGLQRTQDGKFVTICGVPIEKTGFSEWYPGQPSSGANEPCASIMAENISYNDIPCRNTFVLPYICEIEL